MSYVQKVTAVDDRAQAELHYAPRRVGPPRAIPGARGASPAKDDARLRGEPSSHVFNRVAVGDPQWDVGLRR